MPLGAEDGQRGREPYPLREREKPLFVVSLQSSNARRNQCFGVYTATANQTLFLSLASFSLSLSRILFCFLSLCAQFSLFLSSMCAYNTLGLWLHLYGNFRSSHLDAYRVRSYALVFLQSFYTFYCDESYFYEIFQLVLSFSLSFQEFRNRVL